MLVLALGLGACAGARATPGVASAGGPGATPAATASPEDGRAFAACMRENGVDVPDPEPGKPLGKGGVAIEAGKDKLMPALEACRHFMPKGGENTKPSPEQLEQQRQFAACMRENGVPDFPDPDPDGSGAVREFLLDRHDDDVLTALEKCRDIVVPEGQSGRPGAAG